MAKKRALKDAIHDPLVAKAVPVHSSKNSEPPVPALGSVLKVGKTALTAAVAAGFICGWLAGRLIRSI